MDLSIATLPALAIAAICWFTEIPACGEAEWIRLSARQTAEDEVLPSDRLDVQLKRLVCREAEFPSSGADVVTESQWTLVAQIVVGPGGRVERFKLIHVPGLHLEFAGALKAALREWRFEPPKSGGVRQAAELTVAFPKLMGKWSTTACEALKEGAA